MVTTDSADVVPGELVNEAWMIIPGRMLKNAFLQNHKKM